MIRTLCVFFLVGLSLVRPAPGLHAEDTATTEKTPTEEITISAEDRQVIQMMELLQKMELLRDMELLAGETKKVLEEKKE